MNKKQLLKLFFLPVLLLSIAASAQTTVSGKVTDDSGQPLPGVSVVIKSTVNGTNTDVNGNYSLSASTANDILVFSSIGYIKQETSLKAAPELIFSLKPMYGH